LGGTSDPGIDQDESWAFEAKDKNKEKKRKKKNEIARMTGKKNEWQEKKEIYATKIGGILKIKYPKLLQTAEQGG
jgi:hypothetical protein